MMPSTSQTRVRSKVLLLCTRCARRVGRPLPSGDPVDGPDGAGAALRRRSSLPRPDGGPVGVDRVGRLSVGERQSTRCTEPARPARCPRLMPSTRRPRGHDRGRRRPAQPADLMAAVAVAPAQEDLPAPAKLGRWSSAWRPVRRDRLGGSGLAQVTPIVAPALQGSRGGAGRRWRGGPAGERSCPEATADPTPRSPAARAGAGSIDPAPAGPTRATAGRAVPGGRRRGRTDRSPPP
jgi:hypothetical protein